MREETQELYTAIEKKFNQVPEEQILDLTGETDEEKNTLKEAFDKKNYDIYKVADAVCEVLMINKGSLHLSLYKFLQKPQTFLGKELSDTYIQGGSIVIFIYRKFNWEKETFFKLSTYIIDKDRCKTVEYALPDHGEGSFLTSTVVGEADETKRTNLLHLLSIIKRNECIMVKAVYNKEIFIFPEVYKKFGSLKQMKKIEKLFIA